MKTLLLISLFFLFAFLPIAHSQTYYAQKTLSEKPNHHITPYSMHKATSQGIDSSNTLIDYYAADSALFGPANFIGMQGQLINSRYSYYANPHSDTTNSYKAKSSFFMNYACINSIAVAFDAIPGGNIDTIVQAQIDTIYVPIIQVNHSGLKDTLDIRLTSVDVHGYPVTNTYLINTLVIDSNNENNIGAGNDYTVKTIKWAPNYQIQGGRFGIVINYKDSTKQDSCWFIYGYGDFKKVCPYEPSNDTIFASNTHFSAVTTNTQSFTANSFALWNEYAGLGYFPSQEGDNLFYPCNSADTDAYHPGIDGANYLEDIHIAASIFSISYLGVPSMRESGIRVSQNYPNPYHNSTTINYTLLKSSDISIKVTDLAGRQILYQDYGTVIPGEHSIMLNASNFSTGVYFYSISSSGYTITKKMVVY